MTPCGINRREFVAATLVTGFAVAAPLSGEPGIGAGLAVIDRRDGDPVAIAAHMRALGYRPLSLDGDVTPLWQSHLRAFWGAGGGMLVGITRLDALFCIATLAQDSGQRLVYEEKFTGMFPDPFRSDQGLGPVHLQDLPRSADHALRFWIIAPARKSS